MLQLRCGTNPPVISPKPGPTDVLHILRRGYIHIFSPEDDKIFVAASFSLTNLMLKSAFCLISVNTSVLQVLSSAFGLSTDYN